MVLVPFIFDETKHLVGDVSNSCVSTCDVVLGTIPAYLSPTLQPVFE
jgi:hypothetical protein